MELALLHQSLWNSANLWKIQELVKILEIGEIPGIGEKSLAYSQSSLDHKTFYGIGLAPS